jgi:hypothetical protein
VIFDELHRNLESVISSLDKIMVEAMVENQDQIIDLNISQLEDGLTREGTAIIPEYESDDYAKAKKSIGSRAPLGTPNLKLEGNFYSGFYGEPYISGESSGLFVDSRDEKAEKLENKYSGIYGIAPQNNDELFEIIIDDAQKTILDEITK